MVSGLIFTFAEQPGDFLPHVCVASVYSCTSHIFTRLTFLFDISSFGISEAELTICRDGAILQPSA